MGICGECRFADPNVFDDDSEGNGPVLGMLCRRYPPSIFWDGEQAAQTSPSVESTDWCGEHQPREET